MAQISHKPITRAQIKSIHVALSRQGIDDDTYRLMLHNNYGVGTCKDLTRRQASDLLTRLGRSTSPPARRRQRIKNPATKPVANASGVAYLATPAQRQLIDAIAAEIRWECADGYKRWLKVSLGLDRVRTQSDAARVINGLKGLKRHGHARAS